MAALVQLLRQPDFQAFKRFLQRLQAYHVRRALSPLPPDQTNLERGAVAALTEITATLDYLIQQHLNERKQHDGPAQHNGSDPLREYAKRWGSPYHPDDSIRFDP